MNIPNVMQSISEVLTTAEELLEDGDDREVSLLLMSFLKTLLVDLDKVVVEHGVTGSRPQPRRRPAKTRTSSTPAFNVSSTKRPIRNKYKTSCEACAAALDPGVGYVLPNADERASKKWLAFCDTDYRKITEVLT